MSEALPLLAYVRRTRPKTSPVYDSYWRFAAARQEVYFRRVEGSPPPWTDDDVIAGHRFTNAFRAADRVSQYLIRDVIYAGSQDVREVVFRTLLFKLFNKIETWTLLEDGAGPVTTESFDVPRYERLLTDAMARRARVYSAAYIMPVAARFQGGPKHASHLRLLSQMLADGLPQKLTEARRMKDAYALLLAYSGIGPFLAYQYVIDLNYSVVLQFDEMDFVVPGPGCQSGLKKCFSDPGDYSEEDLIRYVCDRQESEFSSRGIQFKTLFGRRLHLIDCQNLFCETDKYARVRHPEATGLAGRTRIKQKYVPNGMLPEPWFPPKWGINQRVAASLADAK